MQGPLAGHKEPYKTQTLMCWLPNNIAELVQEAGIDTANNYTKVTKFLFNWAKLKTTEYNSYRELLALKQGSMNFEQFAARTRKLVNELNSKIKKLRNYSLSTP